MENKTDPASVIDSPHTWHKIVDIRPAGRAPATCIKVSHPSHLYLTRGGILTHNTAGASVPRSYIGRDGMIRVLDTVPEEERPAAILEAKLPKGMKLDPPNLDRIYAPAPEPVRIEAERIAGEMLRAQESFFGEIDTFINETPSTPTGSRFITKDGNPAPNKVKALLPYIISGNKGDIIAKAGNFIADLARKATAVIDAFGGAATYIHALAKDKSLPKNTTWNEWEFSRFVTNDQIKNNPTEVEQALTAIRVRFDAAFPQTTKFAERKQALTARGEVLEWMRQELRRKNQEGQYAYIQSFQEDGVGRLPLKNTPETAAFYLWTQIHMTQNRVVDFALNKEGQPDFFTSGKLNGKDDFDFVDTGKLEMTDKKRARGDAKALLQNASSRLQGVTIKQGDGWKLAAEAQAGALVFIDTSYFAGDKEIQRGKKVMNYGKGTQADGDAQVWYQKLKDHIGPRRNEVTYFITNNFNTHIVNLLESDDWLVYRLDRGKDKPEFIAISGRPDEAASVRARRTRDAVGMAIPGRERAREAGDAQNPVEPTPTGTSGQTSEPRSGTTDGRGRADNSRSARDDATGRPVDTPIADGTPTKLPSGPTLNLQEKVGQPQEPSPETKKAAELIQQTMEGLFQKTLNSQATVPQGNVDAETGQPGYIPTGKAVAFALKAVGRDSFREIVKAHPWWSQGDSGSNAIVTEFIAREVVRAAQTGESPTQAILDHARKAAAQRDATAQRAGLRSQSALVDTYTQISRDADSFKFAWPAPTSKDLKEIVRAYTGEKPKIIRTNLFGDEMFAIKFSDGKSIVLEDRPDGRIIVNASDTNAARDKGNTGGLGYQIAGTYAHNNGKIVVVAGPLSTINQLRRTSNMISSILRHAGNTNHWQPGPDQNVQWTDGDHAQNLENLLNREAEIVMEILGDQMKNVFTDGREYFVRSEGRKGSFDYNIDYSDSIRALAQRFGKTDGIGEATLRRVLLTKSLNDREFRNRISESLQVSRSLPVAQGALYSQSPNAFAHIAELEAAAMREVDGKRTIGDPRLAHSMDNDVWMALDEFRKQTFQAQRESDWKEAAHTMVANDYDGAMRGILAKANAGESLTPIQTKAAEILIAAETQRYKDSGKSAEQRKILASLIFAVRTTRTETARTMAAFRDPHKTPAQRWMQFVGEALFSPSKKLDKMIEEAPHQAEVDARINALEERLRRVAGFASGQQVENEALRRQIEQLRNLTTKEKIIEADIERNKSRIEQRLAEMGITVDDLLTGPVELRLMGSKIIGQHMQGRTARETQVLALIQGKRGGNIADIADRMGMTTEEVTDIAKRFRKEIKAALFARFKNPKFNKDSLDLHQTELGLASNPGERSDEEADALAEEALRMMGFFDPAEHDKIKIEQPARPGTPRKPSKRRGSKPNTKINLTDNGEHVLEWMRPVGEGKNIDILLDEAKRKQLEEAQRQGPANMPGGEGRTRISQTGDRLDFGDQAWQGATAYVINPNDPAQVLQMTRVLNAATREITGWDYINELFIANLLSAPTTQIVNLTGYLYGMGRYTVGRAFRAMINNSKDPGAEQWGEFRPMFEALMDHVGLAFHNAKMAFETEMPVTENLRLKTADVFTMFDEPIGVIPGKAGRIIRIPLRFLLATDEFAKTIFGYTHAATIAYRVGKAKGVKGDNMRKFIAAQLRDRSSGIWPAAQQEARYVAFQQQLRSMAELQALGNSRFHPSFYMEGGLKLLTDFKNKDMADATTIAKLAQFALRLTFPFVRTPYRLLEIGLEMTPFGSIPKYLTAANTKHMPNTERIAWENATQRVKRLGKEARRLGTKEAQAAYRQAIKDAAAAKTAMEKSPNKGYLTAKKDERAILEAKSGLLASLLITMALLRAAEGDDDDENKVLLITGTIPEAENSGGMRQLRARTHPQQSIGIKLPGMVNRFWLDYRRLDPLSTMLATTIDGINQAKRTGKGEGAERIPSRIVSSIYSQLMDKASLQGFSDLSKTISGEWKQDFMAAGIERGSTIFIPNLVRNLARNTDPLLRDRAFNEGNYIDQAKYSALPIAPLAPPPTIDVYGRPIQKKGNFVSRALIPGQPFVQDRMAPLDRTLTAWNQQNPTDPYAISAPNMRSLFPNYAERYNATPEQMQRFAKLRGQILASLAAEKGLTNLRRPTPSQMDDIRNLGTKATNEARKLVFGK